MPLCKKLLKLIVN